MQSSCFKINMQRRDEKKKKKVTMQVNNTLREEESVSPCNWVLFHIKVLRIDWVNLILSLTDTENFSTRLLLNGA